MWRNYVAVAVRTLARSRAYAFINLFGLAVGFAACLMLLLYVRYERSYDAWLPDAENIYQLQTSWTDPDSGLRIGSQASQYAAGAALRQDFRQVEGVLHMFGTFAIALHRGEAVTIEETLATDGAFFDVLPLPLVRGDPATALARPRSLVLSEGQAQRLFGDADPMGRTLTLVMRDGHVDHRVTGIFADLPRNSHLRASMILRFDPASYFSDFAAYSRRWDRPSAWNYVRLRPGADANAIHAMMPQWERRHVPPSAAGEVGGRDWDWRLVNVRDVHLGEAQEEAMSPGNDQATITTFAVIALLILFMACVNFVNLATARASRRAREVALRKVLGAQRKQLVAQFLGESVMLAGLAMLIALAVTELLLPALSAFLEADLRLDYLGADAMLPSVLALVLLVGAAGGLYPALYLSRYQPATVLKSGPTAGEGGRIGWLRSFLVVAQFSVSIGLMICTAIVYAQTVHARTADPGFRREGLLQIENLGRRQATLVADTLVGEIRRIDGVRAATRTSVGLSTHNVIERDVYLPGRARPVTIGNYAVDSDVFATMGIGLVAGRLLDPGRETDRLDLGGMSAEDAVALAGRGGNVVLNAQAARRLGFADPGEAVGTTLRFAIGDGGADAPMLPVTVVGVVGDTRFRSVRSPVEPILYRLGTDRAGTLAVRYDAGAAREVRGRIERLWRSLLPDLPFEADYSEDIVSGLYEGERARSTAFAGFAMLAVVIACLGLYGLAAFAAERRTREIGIRKVLGARTRDIVRLLVWQFTKPVVIANLIAWPAAWWLMRDWLAAFDARIELTPAPFLAAGALTLLIAVLTVGSHAVRVARSNPIDALRYE